MIVGGSPLEKMERCPSLPEREQFGRRGINLARKTGGRSRGAKHKAREMNQGGHTAPHETPKKRAEVHLEWLSHKTMPTVAQGRAARKRNPFGATGPGVRQNLASPAERSLFS